MGPEVAIEVCEIFRSLQGETTHAGRPAVFLRLAGCDLACRWCDTRYAWSGGEEMSLEAILERVEELGPGLAVITGGEPLLQEETPLLAARLAGRGREVLVETSGAYPIDGLLPPAKRILDLKPPSSGAAHRMLAENLDLLRPGDEVKCVLADRADFDHSLARLRQGGVLGRFPVLVSPVEGMLAPRVLAKWVLDSGEPLRLQVQLHRLLWPEAERGV